MDATILSKLEKILIERKQSDPTSSYVASLHQKGLNKILEKIGEEATETLLAAKDHTPKTPLERCPVVKETADLWFHSLVMLTHLNIPLETLFDELGHRMGTSGLVEKATR